MDTKLRSNKNKYIITVIILTILIVTSLGMYSAYPSIKEQAKNHQGNIFQKYDFMQDISNSNYSIYFSIIKNKENKDVKPADIILDTSKKYSYDGEDSSHYRENFNNTIDNYYRTLDRDLKNLEYYAIKKDDNLIADRKEGDINLLLNDNADSNTMEALKNKYSFYMVIDYNDSGKSIIKKLHGADMSVVKQEFGNLSSGNINGFEVKPITNMTYVYAVQKNLAYKDIILSYKNSNEIHSYGKAAEPYLAIAFVLILIVSIIIPYKILKELIGFKIITRTPIELGCFVILMMLMLMADTYDEVITRTIMGELISGSKMVISPLVVSGMIDTINILYWFLSFGVILIGTIIVKHIFKTGVTQYIKDNSLTYKILRHIWRRYLKLYKYCLDINLKENNTKKLIGLLGINLIILFVMSSVWFFGIIIAIIYTIILFIIIRKHYRNISNKYNKLLEATSKIAEGNLDVTVEEDLGIFNAFKKELESIQKGFKKAVYEEVKSQRMKTELISNVSHDLKTPLTSIITYVDLLKDENLSEEKRKEYLNTLDRKSQRLQALIEDLFEVSKATSGNINLNVVNVDVVSLMKQTLLELEDKIAKASLVIKTNYPEEKVILPLDSQRMFRVFENLIINITKYAMTGSRVYIDIFSDQDKVGITLKNIAADEIDFNIDEISERFVRGDKARNTEGSGLGLAIAKSFVELQGGKLDIIVDGDLFKVVITFTKINE